MDTTVSTYVPRVTSNDLREQITEHIRELAEATDAARMSEEMLRYLEVCSRFHHYSPFNIWLILSAMPSATQVAGFKKWRGMKRYVVKGEKGIPILAPVFAPVETEEGEEQEKLVGFKTVYVFDVSQTDGNPLPEPPDWKSPEQNAELSRRLEAFAQSKGITVIYKELGGDIQGVSTGGVIFLSPAAGTKTLVHEIAHEILHKVEESPKDKTIRELEAEAVAYVVSRHFGLDGLSSPNYVALHGADAEMIMAHLERIRATATEVIKVIECVEPVH
jgi:hypothetical protein